MYNACDAVYSACWKVNNTLTDWLAVCGRIKVVIKVRYLSWQRIKGTVAVVGAAAVHSWRFQDGVGGENCSYCRLVLLYQWRWRYICMWSELSFSTMRFETWFLFLSQRYDMNEYSNLWEGAHSPQAPVTHYMSIWHVHHKPTKYSLPIHELHSIM